MKTIYFRKPNPIFFLLIVLSSCFGVLNAQGYEFEWATKVGGNYNDDGNSIAIDQNGDSYITGQFEGTATIYFWDNRGNQIHTQMGGDYPGDQYAKYNALTDYGTAASTPPSEMIKTPGKIISAGTGFIIQALTSGTLDYKNEYRSTLADNAHFFGKTFDESEDDRYRLTLTNPEGVRIMTGVAYFEGGKDNFWIDDTETTGGGDQLYTLSDGYQLAIQGRKPFRNEDQVSLGFKAYQPGYYIISIYDMQGVFEQNQDIYLVDYQLNKTWNLTKEPYRFLSRSGRFNDRFLIVYKPKFSVNQDFSRNEIEFIRKDNQIVINSTIDKITQVEVFDLNSRPVFRKSEINAKNYKINPNNLGHQIIVVSVTTETGEIVNKKFVNK